MPEGLGDCIEILAGSMTQVGHGYCYSVPQAFVGRAKSYQLFPNGNAAMGLRLSPNGNCGGDYVDMRRYYAPDFPNFSDPLSSCTYLQLLSSSILAPNRAKAKKLLVLHSSSPACVFGCVTSSRVPPRMSEHRLRETLLAITKIASRLAIKCTIGQAC
jgi:hypothetical protein